MPFHFHLARSGGRSGSQAVNSHLNIPPLRRDGLQNLRQNSHFLRRAPPFCQRFGISSVLLILEQTPYFDHFYRRFD